MNQTDLVQKIKGLEKDISKIKEYLGFDISKEDVDIENWKKIREISKKIREEIFKEKYPRLYAKIKKGK